MYLPYFTYLLYTYFLAVTIANILKKYQRINIYLYLYI